MIKNKGIFKFIVVLVVIFSFKISIAQTAPIANDDYAAVTQNTTLTAPDDTALLLDNDSDADDDTITIVRFSIDGSITWNNVGDTVPVILNGTTVGTITINADGSYIFIPATDYIGPVPVITYEITDGTFLASADLHLIVQNDPPVTIKDVATVDQDTTLTTPSGAPDNYPSVLDNDTDINGDLLTVTQISIDGGTTWHNVGETVTIPGGIGTITMNADGTYTFIPVAGYSGPVPNITYQVTDGASTENGILYLTVETSDDLLEIDSFSSCNQGYTADGDYKIRYDITLKNVSEARGYHKNSEINNIQLFDDLNAVFGDCITSIDRTQLTETNSDDFIDGSDYPIDFTALSWDDVEFDQSDATPGADGIFNSDSVTNGILYPQQTINIKFCITVEPICNGRDGTSINFDNVLTLTSSRGNPTQTLSITDFHTSETTVAANFYMPNLVQNGNSYIFTDVIEPNATFDYIHRIIIANDGNNLATDVNFNLGLQNFIDEGITFSTIDITQISGPTVSINNTYDGTTDTLLLTAGNNLNAGENIILEIHYIAEPTISSTNNILFTQLQTSMSQGASDGQGEPPIALFVDEFSANNKKLYSYVIWSDNKGDHLDRYYITMTNNATPSSNDQCTCESIGMRLPYSLSSSFTKTGSVTNQSPNGIDEHEEIEFEFTITNTSESLQLENLQITESLNSICGGNIVSVDSAVIYDSTATQNPTINPSFNGTSNTTIFDGTSGILKAADNSVTPAIPAEYIKVRLKVIFIDDCIGNNVAHFSATDASRSSTTDLNSNPANVNVFSDNDNDGISNIIDIDDDNDGIPDLIETNNIDPIADDDTDNIPNYRDPDFGIDSNGDNIVDIFDFDLDGIPNHLDLDSDNDGIFDIEESGNGALDTSNNGTTNNTVGVNGLDNTIETTDDSTATITYTIANSDSDAHFNYLDIDSDNDGIIDNIEAQTTINYNAPIAADSNGLVYASPLVLTDTDGDNTPDYIDLDSDNDLRDDIIEAWDNNNDGVAETTLANADSDNDGLDNNFDHIGTYDATNNNQLPTYFPNVDNSFTSELDWREIPAVVVIINNKTSEIEGNPLKFTVNLVTLNDLTIPKASLSDVIIDFSTIDGTDFTSTYDVAKTPFDYEYTATTITIPSGDTSVDVFVQSKEDTIDELIEFFTLKGIITSKNTIDLTTNTIATSDLDIKSIGEILDNDNAPNISMDDAYALEGNPLTYTIKLTNPTSTPVIIDIVSADGTAISPEDYTSYNNTLTIDGTFDEINNAHTEINFDIETLIDDLNEPDIENIIVTGKTTSNNIMSEDLDKKGFIEDIDPFPTFIVSSPTVIEGDILKFEIRLSNTNFEDVNFNIFTRAYSARTPDDFIAIESSITIPAHQTNTFVEVTTNEDLLIEDIETLFLKAVTTSANPSNIDAEGMGSIIDNDLPNLFSPNNDGKSDYFEIVHLKQYLQFRLQIFDRWGSLVYDYSNNGNPQPLWWDGTRNSESVPEGVYYYTIDYNDGKTKPITGFIQLIR